jgi:predicted nucleic acid-binding protein
MEKVYVDSNVFFYAKIGDREYGRSCAEIVRRISDGRLHAAISALVPLEASNALRKYGLGMRAAEEITAILSLGMDVLSLEVSDLSELESAMSETNVSPYDCAHAIVMKRYGIKSIVSADRDFDKFRWLSRTDPRRFV